LKEVKVKKAVLWLSLFGFFSLIVLQPVFGAENLVSELEALKQRVQELEEKLAQQEQAKKEAKANTPEGISGQLDSVKEAIGNLQFSLGVTGVVQGTIGNDDNARAVLGDGRDVFDGSYSVDLEIHAPVGENGDLWVYLEGGEGDNVTDELGVLGGVNADALGASVNPQISTWGYEHSINDGWAIFTIGKLDPVAYFDGNMVANDECADFISDFFINNNAVEFPDYTPGVRLTMNPTDHLEVNLGWLENDADFEDLFDDSFGIAEFNIKPNFLGREGNYRFYGWINGSDHEEWDDPGANEEGTGFGLSFDQQLSDTVTAFCRFGWQDEDIYEVEKYWTVGAAISGSAWGREEDVVAFGVGQNVIGDEYEDSAGIDAEDETHFECYYSYKLNDHFTLSPMIHVVTNPGGDDDADTVVIPGFRTQMDF
jgi:hypothetical protein